MHHTKLDKTLVCILISSAFLLALFTNRDKCVTIKRKTGEREKICIVYRTGGNSKISDCGITVCAINR